jgi:hypothetical protein
MKRETRGRKTILNVSLTRRICALLAKGSSIKSACILCNIGERTYFDWQERGKGGEEPYVTFFAAATRAREQHKARLITVVMEAAHKDARHAEWLLERQFAAEFAPYDRRPIPREEQPAINVAFPCVLPSGRVADADEIMAVARELTGKWRESEQPKQRENKPIKNEPSEMWYNPVTRRVEPIYNRESLEH